MKGAVKETRKISFQKLLNEDRKLKIIIYFIIIVD